MTVDFLVQQRQVSTLGCFMAGSNNNGSHSPNGITALFIATGQDVANVSESSAAMVYVEKTPEQRLLLLRHPALPDYRHLWRRHRSAHPEGMPGNPGLLAAQGKAHKFAEIVAATVLCGELSLMSAVLAGDWVVQP